MSSLKIFLALILGFLASMPIFASQELIGGRPAKKGEFPEIVYIASGDARCSATVIGPQVILTAAHCSKDGGQIGPVRLPYRSYKVDFVVDQVVYKAVCKQAPLYRDGLEDHDMALCHTDKVIQTMYAEVAKEPPSIGEKVLLTGYGCTSESGGGNDGVLRVGKARVTQLPAEKDHWFYTKDTVALCYGDSGSAAMKVTKGKPHKILGTNSRGDIKELSLMTALWAPESIQFFEDFASEEGVEICGITLNC